MTCSCIPACFRSCLDITPLDPILDGMVAGAGVAQQRRDQRSRRAGPAAPKMKPLCDDHLIDHAPQGPDNKQAKTSALMRMRSLSRTRDLADRLPWWLALSTVMRVPLTPSLSAASIVVDSLFGSTCTQSSCHAAVLDTRHAVVNNSTAQRCCLRRTCKIVRVRVADRTDHDCINPLVSSSRRHARTFEIDRIHLHALSKTVCSASHPTTPRPARGFPRKQTPCRTASTARELSRISAQAGQSDGPQAQAALRSAGRWQRRV
jgi:hypothetical protein